jgi:hypothetical protein
MENAFPRAVMALVAGAGLLVVAAGCGPKEIVPAGPAHPADPAGEIGADEPAPALPASEEAGGGHDDHHHHHGHEGHDPGSHDHGAHDHGADDHGDDPAEVLLAAEMAAYEAARPVLEEYCADCHTTGSARPSRKQKATLRHFSMDAYPFGGHHAHEMGDTMRKVLGVSGRKPTMPKDSPGAVTGDELALVLAWAEAWDAAHAAGAGYHADLAGKAHGHHGHAH